MTQPVLILARLPAALLDPLRERFELVEQILEAGDSLGDFPERERVGIAVTMGNTPLTASTIERLPALRYLCHFGVGTDLLDLPALSARGVLVTNTPGANASCVADLAVTMLLSLVKQVPQADAFVRRGAWGNERHGFNIPLAGRKVGIYGMGDIGTRTAARLAAFEMEVGYYSRTPRPQSPHRRFASLMELAAWADDLVVAVAANAETQNSVGCEVLAALGPSGVLVNVARGSIIDEDALIDALRSRAIAGAGLDTFRNEPDIRKEFRSLDNVILSPHVAGGTVRAVREATATFLANLQRYLDGAPPQNVVR